MSPVLNLFLLGYGVGFGIAFGAASAWVILEVTKAAVDLVCGRKKKGGES